MHDPVRKAHIGGLSIAYRDSGGAGHPVVFLHGSGFSMEAFGHQLDGGMLRDYRLVAFDLPGHGASANATDSDATYSLKGYAAITRALLDKLGIGRAILVGWSLGGHIAMELLATGDLAAGLVITGAPPITLGPLGLLRGFCTNWDLLLASKERFTAKDEQRFLALCLGPDRTEPTFTRALHRADGRVRSSFVRSLLRGEGADQARTVKTSTVPIAVINGIDEPFVRLSYINGLSYGNLWRGRCHLIDDTGHVPMWQKPIVYNALLRDFINEAAKDGVANDEVRYRRA
jgi:pimeloyl-ACP methyl ester carboxylesterase